MNQRSSYIDHTFPHSSCVCLLLVCSLGLALWLQHFAQFILCLEEYPFIVHPENSLCIPPSELTKYQLLWTTLFDFPKWSEEFHAPRVSLGVSV